MFRHTHRWIRSLPAAVWVAALAACGGSDAPPPPAPPPVVGAATLGPAGGSVDGPDGVRLDVPAGALAGNVTFRIARDAGAAPPLPGGTEVVGHVYEITPHGEDFGAGAAVRLPVDVAAVGDRQAFLMKASPGGAWQILAPVERGHNVAHAAIASLSYLAVGVCTPNPGGITQSNLFFEVCPASSSLRWELLDGSGVAVPVPQPPNGSPQPVLLVTQPTTLTLRLSWTRPAGLNRVDELDTGSGRDGPTVLRTPGFTWGSGAPRLEQVNGSVVRSFTVAVDPASIAGAGAPNGVVRNLWAQARYRFQPLPPLARVDWSYDAFIPIRVRYLGTQPTLVSGPTPESVSVVENATFQLAVQATGPGLTIQWRYFTGVNDATGAPAEGTNNQPTYQSPPVPLAWNGRLYYARLCATSGSPAVTNCIDSPASPLTVRPFTEQATFTTHPVSRSVIEGETVDFTAAARGTPTPTLRWVLDRTCSSQLGLLICSGTTLTAGPVTSGKLAGATIDLSVPDRLRITSVPLTADGATLTAVASQTGFPNVASNPATLGVSARPVAPSITTPLAPQSITAGGTATYTVGVAGTEPLTLQWTLGGTPLANGAFSLPSGCSGTASVQDNGRRLVLTGVSPGCDGLTVTVRVTNAAGGPASSSAALNVSSGTPTSGGACFGGPFGWCYVQPLPNANRLRTLAFTSMGELVVAGDVGTFQRSTDFGDNWNVRWTTDGGGARHGWRDLALPTDTRIVAVGRESGIPGTRSAAEGIYVSTDGGASWTLRRAASGLNGVAFRDANVGVAVGGSADVIWRTADGGDTWTALPVALAGRELQRVAYAGGMTFVAVGEHGAIWRSTDAGTTWTSVPSGASGPLTDLAFNGAGIGLAVVGGPAPPQLLRTADFGMSWQAVSLADAPAAVAFASTTVAVAIGRSGETYRSVDAGATWSAPNMDSVLVLGGAMDWRLRFANAATGIAVGRFGAVARTGDGGLTWTRLAGGIEGDGIEELQAAPDRSVVLGVLDGLVRRSTDAGNTWSEPASGRLRLHRIGWGSNTRALGTSADGIYRTDDAGQTWTRVRALGPTNSTAGAVAMASATVAIAARSANGVPFGQGGVLERSIDGGASWSAVTLPGVASFDLLDARFASSTLGYVGGTGLWRTTDGGATWAKLTLPAPTVPGTDLVTHVYVTPGNVLFVVTWADVWRSADQGASFTRVLDNQYLTGGLIRRMAFVDANVGLGVGAGGIYRTTDAGVTWTRLDLPLDAPMQSVAWAGAGIALAGGESGALLRNLALGQLAAPPPGAMLRQTVRSLPPPTGAAPPAKRAAAAGTPRARAADG